LVIADLIGRAYRQGAAPTSAAGKNLASWDLGLPMVNNEFVQYEIKSMTTREREELLAGYQRAGRYRPMILKKLEEAGLPSQLSWLPLVESWFKVSALSRASALGLWQFISSTGLRYGLARDEWADLRLDPERSTDAAIAYLSDLHRLFGDWPKALAAYNCGEGRIMRAQKRSETEFLDFWDLYALLPNETRRYVPRLIAALQIIENPQAFGITLPEPDAPLGDSERVTVTRTLQLAALDKSLGLSEGTLAAYNPELRQKATPPAAYELRVPAGRGADVLAAAATLPVYTPPKPKYLVHSVRSGDTLSTIAERYHTSVSAIMRMNSIRSAHRIWPGQRLRIPTRG
jgi:membrane-bound lytic murein transglycosylase D